MKVCNICKQEKSVSDFYRCRGSLDGLQGYCKKCSLQLHKKYYRENREKVLSKTKAWGKENRKRCIENNRKWKLKNPRRARHHYFKRNYGISLEDFEKLLKGQSGKCAICFIDLVKPCLDHDHKTGRIRGVLCPPCNQGIGSLRDSPEFCRNAAKYLEKEVVEFVSKSVKEI